MSESYVSTSTTGAPEARCPPAVSSSAAAPHGTAPVQHDPGVHAPQVSSAAAAPHGTAPVQHDPGVHAPQVSSSAAAPHGTAPVQHDPGVHAPQVSSAAAAPNLTASKARPPRAARMRAAVREHYGSPEVLAVQSMEPPEPGPGEVRINVRASSVNAADWFVLTGRPWLIRVAFGLLRPKIPVLGMDVAGVVESVGPGVTRLRVGDAVFGEIERGAYAELACGRARYDIIFDLVGCASLRSARRCLRRGGVYVSSVGRLGWVAKTFLASLLPGQSVAVLAARPSAEDLAMLGEWVASGRVVPAIDRRYRLDDVAEALREQGEGRGRGKAVIVIADASEVADQPLEGQREV